MSDDDSEPTSHDESYAVGYGRPPKEHQFKKGHCPNKRGRPKGSKSFVTMVREELSKAVQVKADGKLKSMPVGQALLMRTLREGIGGSRRAADQGIRLMERYGPQEDSLGWDLSKLTDDELDAFEAMLAKIAVEP